jgi:hypothetical protein
MNMALVVLYDKSNPVNCTNAALTIAIEKQDNLTVVMQQLAYKIDHLKKTAIPGYYNELHIACNCSATGLELGSGITHENAAEIFKPLRFKVGNIVFLNSEAALIYKHGNNGALLCKRIAAAAYANVTASVSFKELSLHYPNIKYSQEVKDSTLCATWNCFGKISLINKYDADGKLFYTRNYPGNKAMQFVFEAICNSSYSIKQLPALHACEFVKTISRIGSRMKHYLYQHTIALVTVKH